MTGPDESNKAWSDPLRRSLKYLSLLGGSLGSILPGAAYFLDHGPPLFQPLSLLTSGIGVVALVVGVHSKRPRGEGFATAGWLVSLAMLALVGYEIARPQLTVSVPPPRAGPTIQIGFGLEDWSLSEIGKAKLKLAAASSPIDSVRKFAMAAGVFGDPDLVWTLWKRETVMLAGSILVLLFLGGFVSWTYGFGVLAASIGAHQRAA